MFSKKQRGIALLCVLCVFWAPGLSFADDDLCAMDSKGNPICALEENYLQNLRQELPQSGCNPDEIRMMMELAYSFKQFCMETCTLVKATEVRYQEIDADAQAALKKESEAVSKIELGGDFNAATACNENQARSTAIESKAVMELDYLWRTAADKFDRIEKERTQKITNRHYRAVYWIGWGEKSIPDICREYATKAKISELEHAQNAAKDNHRRIAQEFTGSLRFRVESKLASHQTLRDRLAANSGTCRLLDDELEQQVARNEDRDPRVRPEDMNGIQRFYAENIKPYHDEQKRLAQEQAIAMVDDELYVGKPLRPAVVTNNEGTVASAPYPEYRSETALARLDTTADPPARPDVGGSSDTQFAAGPNGDADDFVLSQATLDGGSYLFDPNLTYSESGGLAAPGASLPVYGFSGNIDVADLDLGSEGFNFARAEVQLAPFPTTRAPAAVARVDGQGRPLGLVAAGFENSILLGGGTENLQLTLGSDVEGFSQELRGPGFGGCSFDSVLDGEFNFDLCAFPGTTLGGGIPNPPFGSIPSR